MPALPSTVTTSPSRNRVVAPATPTTVGTRYSRARIARWLSALPVSATSAPSREMSGARRGSRWPTTNTAPTGLGGIESIAPHDDAAGRGTGADADRAVGAARPTTTALDGAVTAHAAPSSSRRNREGRDVPVGSRRASRSAGRVRSWAARASSSSVRSRTDPSDGSTPTATSRRASSHAVRGGQLLQPPHPQAQGLAGDRGRVGIFVAPRRCGQRRRRRCPDRRSPVRSPMLGASSASTTGSRSISSAIGTPSAWAWATADSASDAPVTDAAAELGMRRPAIASCPWRLASVRRPLRRIATQLVVGELVERGHGRQVGVDAADEVGRQLDEGAAQPADTPCGLQAPRRRTRIEPAQEARHPPDRHRGRRDRRRPCRRRRPRSGCGRSARAGIEPVSRRAARRPSRIGASHRSCSSVGERRGERFGHRTGTEHGAGGRRRSS